MNKIILPLILLLTGGFACSQRMDSPEGYNLSSPEVFKMPALLDEISGIAFNNGNADTIYAEQDEEGKLFFFSPKDMNIQSTQFAKKGDYEDLAIANDNVFILRSDGHLVSFSLSNSATGIAGSIREFPIFSIKGGI